MQIGIRLHDTKKGTLEERVAIAEEQGFSCAHLALKKVISEYSVADSVLTPGFSCYLKKLFAAVLAVLLALSFSGCSELTGMLSESCNTGSGSFGKERTPLYGAYPYGIAPWSRRRGN